MVGWLLLLILAPPVAAADAGPCRPIRGLRPLLAPGTVLLLGELHGTRESPAFALQVACQAAQAGLPVLVGLELRPSEQALVDAFLASAGGAQDRDALLEGAVWREDYQDGRASHAMFGLIDGLRELRAQGRDVRVALFDAPVSGGGQQRERGMARNVTDAVSRSEGAMTIVLTGNLHSRVTRGNVRDATYEPMGYLLDREPSIGRVVSLDVAHAGGSAWVCAPDCGVLDLRGNHDGAPWHVEMDEATRPAGHAGWYHVGAIRASIPARMSPDEVTVPVADATERVAADATAQPTPEASPAASGADERIEGDWQAYDYASQSRIWRMRFEGGRFRAQGGEDDWYEGRITIRPAERPAQIDFAIEDCRCAYKGTVSQGIYRWDGDSLIIAAPRPGAPRPTWFVEASGEMLQLFPLEEIEHRENADSP